MSGSSYSVENQAVSTLSVGAISRVNDELPADDDEFVLAFGAAMRVFKESSIEGTFGSISAPDFSTATVAVVTVGQLKNPGLMNSFQAALFTSFTAGDYAQLLSLDPRAAGAESTDTRDCSASYGVYFDSLFNTLAVEKTGSSTQCQ